MKEKPPSLQVTSPPSRQPLDVRAWLWRLGSTLGEHDDGPRLWLHVRDGRVLALRLRREHFGNEAIIPPLLEVLGNDLRGECSDLNLPVFGFAKVLYAAPVLPVARNKHERATAQYQPTTRSHDDVTYRLAQLRGPYNAHASRAMSAWAQRIAERINAPELKAARCAALASYRVWIEAQRGGTRSSYQARLDEQAVKQLVRALDWLGARPLDPAVLLCAPVAGFAYHAGPKLRSQLQMDAPLELVREPDNPQDPFAVRLDWQGQSLGYVPRRYNHDIAARLDAGEALTARINSLRDGQMPGIICEIRGNLWSGL